MNLKAYKLASVDAWLFGMGHSVKWVLQKNSIMAIIQDKEFVFNRFINIKKL